MIHLGLCVACGRIERISETSRQYVLHKFKDQSSPCQSDSQQETQDIIPYSGSATHYHSAWRNNPEELRVLMISHNPKSTFSRSQQSAIGHYPKPHSSKSLRHIPVLWTKLLSNSPRQSNLKVSHPRCVVKIQVREENPILYSHKTQLNIKLSLLHYNMFRPKLSAIFRLYMKPMACIL